MNDEAISYAHLANLAFIEELYQKYSTDPASIDPSWRYFFEGMAFSSKMASTATMTTGSGDLKIVLLIQAYREYGHLLATCNPIATKAPEEPYELSLKELGFSSEDLSKTFPTCGFLKEKETTLSKLIEALKATYCKKIGVEFMGLGDPELEKWVQQKIEPYFPFPLSPEDKLSIIHYLNKAELFESFIHTKYVGQKRFSLEGGETLIPMLAALIDKGAEQGVEEVVLGMAHRGRLNVLANILGKSYATIFHEFEDFYSPDLSEGTGDVKYHRGFSGALDTRHGKHVEVNLMANPSHLESVDPVVEGQVRAKQELKHDEKHKQKVIPILIHGDASVAGQGVVYETLQMCRLKGYTTGGTIHIVVNNQIGFTATADETRSTRYCTDMAKGFGVPVFHVNAEDPEGCITVAMMAMEIRQKFGCDVFIDMNCYRKYGHNEGDEPTFTQPEQYKIIKDKKTIREIFKEQLIGEGVLNAESAQALEEEFKADLHKAIETVASFKADTKQQNTQPKKQVLYTESSVKQVPKETLVSLAQKFCGVPAGLQVHPKIERLLKSRLEMVQTDPTKKSVDWGMGEHLAFATILNEKIHIRLSGQDCQRGTFSHRHAVWVDQNSGKKYFSLSHLTESQAPFHVYNSHLSEFAVLGFDLGYSLAYPESLTIWEAQFGDFSNGAQVIIDQYLSSAEQKWSLTSNITLLLPHGYEGQGPEHSSARMERYLQLSAEGNMIIANCSTPAQFFHLLRRQAFLVNKRPLIVFTPKALLRHPLALSALSDFYADTFHEVLDDPTSPDTVKKLFFCTGKVFYDLIQEREKRNISDIAIIRVEQLYPFPEKRIKEILQQYSPAQAIYWVQEEHSNMGAWDYVRPQLQEILGSSRFLRYVGRTRSASAAASSHALHKQQYEMIMQEAFT